MFVACLSLFWHLLKALCAPCFFHTDRLHTDRTYPHCILTEREREKIRGRHRKKTHQLVERGEPQKELRGRLNGRLYGNAEEEKTGIEKQKGEERGKKTRMTHGCGVMDGAWESSCSTLLEIHHCKKAGQMNTSNTTRHISCTVTHAHLSRLTAAMHFLKSVSSSPQKAPGTRIALASPLA